VVAGLSVDTFHWLLDRSIPVQPLHLQQLNERLGQFIAAREIDRLGDPAARVARSLAALFHPILYPGVGSLCASPSRSWATWSGCPGSAVNEALKRLDESAAIGSSTVGVRVLDLERLRRYCICLGRSMHRASRLPRPGAAAAGALVRRGRRGERLPRGHDLDRGPRCGRRRRTTAIVPVGGTEQSGPHMALGKHNVRVHVLAGRIAERLGNALVAPVVAYVPEGDVAGPSGHIRFAGTISVTPAAFEACSRARRGAFAAPAFATSC
jgi:hypothetical protein